MFEHLRIGPPHIPTTPELLGQTQSDGLAEPAKSGQFGHEPTSILPAGN